MKIPRDVSRRTALKLAAGTAAAVLTAPAARLLAASDDDGFVDVRRPPDSVTIVTEGTSSDAAKAGADRWEAVGTVVETVAQGDGLRVTLAAHKAEVKQLRLAWKGSTRTWKSALGDHWERSYGDLQWRRPDTERTHPWYLMAHTGSGTHAVGVATQPGAFCGWTCDPDGLRLVCDVRSGGVGVRLGDRTLHVCDISARRGRRGETPFAAACAFCGMLCAKPRMPDHIVYGANDWYYAYGNNTPAGLLDDARLLSELSAGIAERPYCVIDDGWQTKTKVEAGQWSAARPTFGSMAELAASMTQLGVRPGIWMRPLIDEIGAWRSEWHLARAPKILDPTIPDVKQMVAADIRRLRQWGYRLIKHDYSTVDILGRWGKDMQAGSVTADGWSFASRSHTTAEVIADLYRVIREAAGDAVIIGCNTVGHLAAGLFELNRIGDDTSGSDWGRNPQMGVNALAFRGPQQGAFYGADADCCPVTKRLEWGRARQWLDLVARSGTPLFVSVERAAVDSQVRRALRDALATASRPAPLAEPLDWLTTPIPRRWKLSGEIVAYDWS